MIAGIWQDWFGWHDGAVLTNLIAWIIGLACGLYPLIRRHRKDIKAMEERLHARLDAHDEHLHKIRKHLDLNPFDGK